MSGDPYHLTFDAKPADKYPHGYWYVYSEITDCEGEGPDPLTAISALALAMEQMWKNRP